LRSYDVAMASLAINAPLKWTDNAISQHDVANIVTTRRGIARRIPHTALLHLALARQLHVTLGMSVRDALELARELLSADETTGARRGLVHIACDRAELERTLDLRLREALESAPVPRRGRPPRRGGPIPTK
jgi:hypothetical protein